MKSACFNVLLPVATNQVQFIEWRSARFIYLVDKSGNLWFKDFLSAGNWENRGTPPGGAVDASESTWGSVKGKFKDKE